MNNEEKKTNENVNVNKEIEKQVDKKLESLIKQEIQQSNIDYVYKLIDIKKDIKGMEEQEMMYRGNYRGDYGNYDNYSGGRSRDSMGRYMENGNYGRRGRYRGEDALDEMKYHYGAYQDSYNTGNYNAKEDSSYKMIEAFKEFVYSVGEELEPKDKQMFKQAMQEMSQKLN